MNGDIDPHDVADAFDLVSGAVVAREAGEKLGIEEGKAFESIEAIEDEVVDNINITNGTGIEETFIRQIVRLGLYNMLSDIRVTDDD